MIRKWCSIPASLLLLSGLALANPSGYTIRHGEIQIRNQGDALRIIQQTNKGIIDWDAFSIENGQTTRFVVPNSRSATLNRVTGAAVSRIDGALSSNGQVFLLNPNGVVVGRNGSIDVAGFTASTLDISDREFLAGGDLRFRGDSQAAVVNLGSISAFDGDIFLIASTVDNAGLLRAPNGTVGLAAGNDVLIKESGAERVFVRGASGEKKENGVVNTGTIQANVAELKSHGGNFYGMAVKNEGRVAASAVTREGGQIFLRAGGGTVRNTGTLVAKRPAQPAGGRVVVDGGENGTAEVGGTVDAGSGNGKGGTVLILGDEVNVFEGSLILADGETGGGDVRIGGGRRGEDPLLMNATDVTVGSGTIIDASARNSGDGGEIIVFAENSLDFNGHAAARGGAVSGDGGFVEVSGKRSLSLPRLMDAVDVSAANGQGGTFLIDPTNIFVASDGTPGTITSPAMGPVLLDSDIETFLQNNGSLIIETDDVGTEQGNVDFSYGSVINWSSDNSLSVQAHNVIYVQDNVSIETTGAGNILLDGQGGVEIGTNSTYPGEETRISVQGGHLEIRNDSLDPNSNGVGIFNSMLSASEGKISITGNARSDVQNGIRIHASSVSTGTGDIDISGISEVGNGVFLEGSRIQSSDGGEIDILGRAILSNFNHDGIRIDDTEATNETMISTGVNANITLTGEGTGPDGKAIRFVEPFSTRASPFVGGDGTQNVAFDSLGGDVDVSYVDANDVKFADPDGVGQAFTARNSNFNTFTAVNVGSVDVQVDQTLEIRDIKLATNAIFTASSGNLRTTGLFDAGNLIELNTSPGNDSSFQVYSPLSAPEIRFNGGGVNGNQILTQGTFTLEGVSFSGISGVFGVGSGDDILIDSSQSSVIDLSTETFPFTPDFFDSTDVSGFSATPSPKVAIPSQTIAVIRGVEFRGYEVISGGEGDDTFNIALDEDTEYNGTLAGGGGDDKFIFTPGGTVGTIVGGAGIDTVDYSAFQTSVFADFSAKRGTQVNRVDSMDSVIGGSATDYLTGTSGNDDFRILSDGAGTLNGKRFSNFETLDGVEGDDKFKFFNQATVSQIIGGAGRDALILNDRNLGGVNTYTISDDTITRNPTYRFSGVEVLTLLLGGGDDTVVTRGNGLRLNLDGGNGFDTLEMGNGRYLQDQPFQLGGSTVTARNFEAPVKGSNSKPAGENQALLTQQTNQVPNPDPKNGKGGKEIDQFTNNGDQSNSPDEGNLMGNRGNAPGGAFGAAASSVIAGQAVVILIDGDQYLLSAPASLDGTFSLPPVGAIKDLRDSLTSDAWKELADAIEFDGGMILIMPDGPVAIDLEAAAPADVAAQLGLDLNADAAKELFAALEMSIVIPLTSEDGAISIAIVPLAIAPEIVALLDEHLGDAAFAELTAALDTE